MLEDRAVGCVYFIGMALWGFQRVKALSFPFIAIMPTYAELAKTKRIHVTTEVLLSIRRLTSKYMERLRVEWDFILQVLEEGVALLITVYDEGAFRGIEILSFDENGRPQRPNIKASVQYELLFSVQEMLCTILDLVFDGKFFGHPDKVYSLVDKARLFLPETAALDAMEFFARRWIGLPFAEGITGSDHNESAIVSFVVRCSRNWKLR